ncbi:MAG: lipid-binding SYLF domain-containing protein [Alphaproteobacteria bacterium]
MVRGISGFIATVAVAGLLATPAARAQTTTPQQELVDRSALAVVALRRDERLGPSVVSAIDRAKAIVIIPSLLKGGFILGGEGGRGVLLARREDGRWGSPAFITLGAASIGLQIGGQVSEVVFTIMTDKGLNAVLVNKFKLGADASVALGPVGGNVEASTTTAIGADIFSYARTQGLFGGGAFEGAVITQRDEWNEAYYGAVYTPRRIITDPAVPSPGAASLRAALDGK